VALSGGIDSSLVYAGALNANPDVRGLTVQFDDPRYDEATAAQAFARHLSGRQLNIRVDAAFNRETLDRLLLHFDQPFADSSAIPVYYLTKGTQQFTRVLIGGDGGDELFNGYASLASLPTARRVGQAGVGGIVARLLAIGSTLSGDDTRRTLARAGDLFTDKPADMLFDWLSWLPRHTRHDGRTAFLYPQDDGLQVYHSVFRKQEPRSFEARLVFEHFTKLLLSDYLRKTDMMSMLNSIEYRVPLLDEDLVGFALSIPFRQKSSLRSHKRILRALHQRTFPPESSQAPKRGFSIPLKDHLTADDLRHMQELVLGSGSICRSFVRSDYLQFVFDVATGKRQGSRQLSPAGTFQRALLFYSLELWYQRHASRSQSVAAPRQPVWAMSAAGTADRSSRVPFFSSN
jgi:asparagine synthase (glutamine-hydrolysing)